MPAALRFSAAPLAFVLALAAVGAQAQPVNLIFDDEPNNTTRQAQDLPVGAWFSTASGLLGTRKDVDVYKLTVPLLTCVGAALTPSPLSDFDLELLNSFGLVVDRSANRGWAQVEVLAACGLPLSQTYYLRIKRHSGQWGVLGGYLLSVTEVQPMP